MARAAVPGGLRARRAWRPAVLVERRPETAAASTLVLRVDGWNGHVAGQHVDVRLTAEDGYQAVRSYSLAAPADGESVEITVQRTDGGEVSPFLVEDLSAGDEVEVTIPGAGVAPFVLPIAAFTSDTLGNLVFLRTSVLRDALGADADAFAGGLFDTASIRFRPDADPAQIARDVQALPSVVVYVPVRDAGNPREHHCMLPMSDVWRQLPLYRAEHVANPLHVASVRVARPRCRFSENRPPLICDDSRRLRSSTVNPDKCRHVLHPFIQRRFGVPATGQGCACTKRGCTI